MADARRTQSVQWTGYGSLASVMDYRGPPLRPSSPPSLSILSPRSIPTTPSYWGSPYSASSPSDISSPETPSAPYTLYSPTASHSAQLSSSKPTLYPNYPSAVASPFLLSTSPPLLIGSPTSLHSPSGFPAQTITGLSRYPGPLVPQRAYKGPSSLPTDSMQIDFNFAGGIPGIPMRLLRDARAIDLPIIGGNSVPFPESVASTITLRIWMSYRYKDHTMTLTPFKWPGYLQYSRRMTMRKASGLLMRSELAMAISEVYKDFIEEAREDPKDPGQAKWRVGRGHITVNDLILLRMFKVSQGSWQADVQLETD
ncbi:hypothetical protein FRC16_008456 [Serendipita sp. 398]|nr:hypothetical protein FRC16_008456 [Serendipita sp. 398]